MFQTLAPLVLASASPRRRELLEQLGINFATISADVPEEHRRGESAAVFVERLAREKAQAIARQQPAVWVLGADTVVVTDDEILGKPEDWASARRMLHSLAGRWHRVWTGVALCNIEQGVSSGLAVSSEVLFSGQSREMIDAYVKTGEPLDKAGAYGIQGRGACLVEQIRGSYSNIVGLPLAEVVGLLLRFKVVRPAA